MISSLGLEVFRMSSSSKMRQKQHISLKETMNSIIPDLNEDNIKVLQIFLALIIGLVIIVLVLKIFRKSSKRSAVLLMGLCESGKTQMFSQICYGWEAVTVTSLKESHAPYKVGKRELVIYDLPGHERIRYTIFEKVKSQAKAVVFLIDSSTIQKDIRDVAEFLYNILCDASVQSGLQNLLIVCNKQDLPLAKAKTLIQTTLEKEMNNLRVSKANQLQSVGGEGKSKTNFLGKKGTHFEFSQLNLMKIEFIECATSDDQLMDGIKSWLDALA